MLETRTNSQFCLFSDLFYRKRRRRKASEAVANQSELEFVDQPYYFHTLDQNKAAVFSEIQTTRSITATATAEATTGVDRMMEADEIFSFYDEEGGIPQTLDELVDLLDIKVSSGTAGSSDIQHFPTFASEDMWPI